MTIAMTPASRGVGWVQLASASPAEAAGTSPAPTAPTVTPMKNGTNTDERANVAPSARASPIVAASPRSANAPPRSTIPIAARKSGT